MLITALTADGDGPSPGVAALISAWLDPAGDAVSEIGLQHRADGRDRFLLVQRHGPAAAVRYDINDGDDQDAWFSVGDADALADWIDVGDESYVPRGSLVGLDAAGAAIRAFHEDPLTRDPSLTWIRGSELSDPFD